MVYISSLIARVEYTSFLFTISVILPLVLTPPVVILLIKMTKHLRYYKEFLENEIKKNKEKDVIMYEQSRFAVIGEMMANISHQWKQPLNTINLSVISAKLSNYDEKTLDQSFDIIEANVNYLANTVNDFLSFFDKKSIQEVKPLEDVIQEIENIYLVQLEDAGIALKVDLQNSAKDVSLALSVSQVILNLLTNAKDALQNTEGKKEIEMQFIAFDDFFKIRCCDTGEGVAEENIYKVFEPYFTTKDKTQGTGLGLYMSKQIIKTLFDGELYLDKEDRSCFVMDIPYGVNCRLETK
jgi:signal transduction histidine kinase